MLQIARPKGAAEQADWLSYGQDLQPLVSQPSLPNCEVCVIVPVRNEAQKLEATLQALANQIDLDGNPLDTKRYEIIVLANNCSDDSANIARRFARSHSSLVLHTVEVTLRSDRAYIGWVRKLLMDEAYRRLALEGRGKRSHPPRGYRGVIASTDGDTQVDPTWVAAILKEIERGADAVGGRIFTDPVERHALNKVTSLYFLRYVCYRYLVAQMEAYLDPTPSDPAPRHHQHFGGSLAVTTEIYARVGGLPPTRTPEDVAFYEALMRVDARFRHSPQVRVFTSARVVGKTQAGLANRLAQLMDLGAKQQHLLVESADLVETRYIIRHILRSLWRCKHHEKLIMPTGVILASSLAVPLDWLLDTISWSPTFGLLVDKIGKYQQQQLPLYSHSSMKVAIPQAISDLRIKVHKLRNRQYSQDKSDRASLDALKQIEPILLLPQPF